MSRSGSEGTRRPLRIAHVISTPRGVGGAEKILLALIRGGSERGWEQAIFNPFEHSSTRTELAELSSPIRYEARKTTRWVEIPSARVWLSHHLRDFAPAILHAHLFHGQLLSATLKVPGCDRILSHHHGGYFRLEGRWWAERLDIWAGRRYDQVVACSNWVHSFLIDHYGYSENRVRTIHNGWEGQPLPRRSSAFLRIVSVGNLRREKGHSTLLRAFLSIAGEIPNARLVLVGDGPERATLERQAQAFGLKDRVDFEGAVNDVWPYLAEADVFVLPSRSEALGIAVLEAMAAGAPVVASAVGGVPELIEDGVSGTLVPAEDEEALALSLRRLLKSPQERSRLGEAGREKAQLFRMNDMVAHYFDAYDDLLAGQAHE